MNRRQFALACSASLAVLAAAGPAAALAVQAPISPPNPKKERPMNPFQPLFEKSLNEKKGLTLWIGGQSVALAVTKIGDGWIEGKNRELASIVVRIDRIDAAGIA